MLVLLTDERMRRCSLPVNIQYFINTIVGLYAIMLGLNQA